MPPGMHDSMSSLATHSPTIVSVSTPRRSEDDEQPNSTGRPAKRAKNKTGTHLITVKDPDPESRPGRKNPIRVKLNLQEVNPENYSSTNHLSKNSVYPRSCAYLRAQASPGKRDRRVLEYDQGEEDSEDNDEPVCGRTIVPVPSLEEGQHELAVPMISRAKRRKEEQINDMGYRLAWSGQKNLDNRNVLLQIACKIFLLCNGPVAFPGHELIPLDGSGHGSETTARKARWHPGFHHSPEPCNPPGQDEMGGLEAEKQARRIAEIEMME